MPFQVALTGGIASGKTLISDEFDKLGVAVIDTDVIAHQIVEPGQPALQEIAFEFGDSIIGDGGRLRRKVLRNLIFTDPNAKDKLEAILHPRIRQRVKDEIEKIYYPYCIIVIPLLTESGGYQNVDRVLVVDVDKQTQIHRLMARDDTSLLQATQVLAAQASREDRLSISDDVLDNSHSIEDARQKVGQLHEKYLQLAEKAANS
jgi:dephospho-CoA kinase